MLTSNIATLKNLQELHLELQVGDGFDLKSSEIFFKNTSFLENHKRYIRLRPYAKELDRIRTFAQSLKENYIRDRGHTQNENINNDTYYSNDNNCECRLTGIHHVLDISNTAYRWQHASLGLTKCLPVRECMKVFYNVYKLGIIGCTLWFQDNNTYPAAADSEENEVEKPYIALKHAIKHVEWIRSLIKAMKYAFERNGDGDKLIQNCKDLTIKNLFERKVCDIRVKDDLEAASDKLNQLFRTTVDGYPVYWIKFNKRIKMVLIEEVIKNQEKKKQLKTQIVFKIILLPKSKH